MVVMFVFAFSGIISVLLVICGMVFLGVVVLVRVIVFVLLNMVRACSWFILELV